MTILSRVTSKTKDLILQNIPSASTIATALTGDPSVGLLVDKTIGSFKSGINRVSDVISNSFDKLEDKTDIQTELLENINDDTSTLKQLSNKEIEQRNNERLDRIEEERERRTLSKKLRQIEREQIKDKDSVSEGDISSGVLFGNIKFGLLKTIKRFILGSFAFIFGGKLFSSLFKTSLFKDIGNGLFKILKKSFSVNILRSLKSIFSVRGFLITGLVVEGLNFIRELLTGKKIGETRVGKIIDTINNSIISIFSSISKNSKKFSSTLSNIPIIGPILGGLFGIMVDSIGTIIKFVKSPNFKNFIDNINKTIIDFMSNYGPGAVGVAKAWGKKVPIAGSLVGGLIGLVLDTSFLALSAVKSKAIDIKLDLIDRFKSAFDSVKETFLLIILGILDTATNILNKIPKKFRILGLSSLIENLNVIQSGINEELNDIEKRRNERVKIKNQRTKISKTRKNQIEKIRKRRIEKRQQKNIRNETSPIISNTPFIATSNTDSKAISVINLRTSERGKQFIKREEGFSRTSFPDPSPQNPNAYSIGYGTQVDRTVFPPRSIGPGETITRTKAEQMFQKDIEFREKELKKLLGPNTKLTQGQFDSLMSLAFNVGIGNLRKSKERGGGISDIIAGDFKKGAQKLFNPETGFVKSLGVTLPGLQKRRLREATELAQLDISPSATGVQFSNLTTPTPKSINLGNVIDNQKTDLGNILDTFQKQIRDLNILNDKANQININSSTQNNSLSGGRDTFAQGPNNTSTLDPNIWDILLTGKI